MTGTRPARVPGTPARTAGAKRVPKPVPPCCVPGCPDPLGGLVRRPGTRPRRLNLRPYGYDGDACNRCGQRVIAAWRRRRGVGHRRQADEARPRDEPKPDPEALERLKAEVREESLKDHRRNVKGGYRYSRRVGAGWGSLDRGAAARRIVKLWDRRDLRGLTAGG